MRTNDHSPPEDADHESEFHNLAPSARAQRLFAASAAEHPAWELVARQLDPIIHAPCPPDVGASFAEVLTYLQSVGHGLRWEESRIHENTAQTQIKHDGCQPWTRLYARSLGVKRRIAFAVVSCIAMVIVGAWALQSRIHPPASNTNYSVAYVTRNAQRAAVTLSDGTHVQMNVGSTLRVPSEYGIRSRTVYLNGEAEFTVEHNRQRPFVVHSGTTIVRDLATRFVVRAYSESESTLIAVADGRVSVHSMQANVDSSVVVNGGESATVAQGGAIALASQSSLDNPFSWTAGKLTFVNVPIRDALAQVARWYDVNCELLDTKLLAKSLTYTFTDAALTDRQLTDLADVLGAYVVRHGRIITFIARK